MPGGKFDYVQYRLEDPAREIQARILLNRKSHAEAYQMLCEAEEKDSILYEILYSVREFIDFWKVNPLGERLPEVWDSQEKCWRLATSEEIQKHNSEPVFQYRDEEIRAFREGIRAIRRAAVYLERIDWLLSGDDGEEAFQERLAEQLAELEKEEKEEDRQC